MGAGDGAISCANESTGEGEGEGVRLLGDWQAMRMGCGRAAAPEPAAVAELPPGAGAGSSWSKNGCSAEAWPSARLCAASEGRSGWCWG